MGQAKNRGPLAQRIELAQTANAALTHAERERAAWMRLPASVRRRHLQAKSFGAALEIMAEVLSQPTKSTLDTNLPRPREGSGQV
jgi:hypothetical protein